MSDTQEDKQMSDNEEQDIKEERHHNDSEMDDIDEESIIKVLIATDIHLGYELTTKRAQEDDSFRTFEEILQYAYDNEVDMVLLGGDLFHEAKPPHNVVMKCLELLRTYCLNDKPVKIQFLTDPEIVFSHCAQKIVNFEDPNMNIGIPVFSIHGNHDDPSYGAIGSMDVLSATGLINYFGKWTDVTKVTIAPLLIRKGVTTIALYGLSYMNDQRLSRLMRNNKFHMLQTDMAGDTFNIFVLHQNRAMHSQNSYVPEELLPDFINLVVWGHEHECLIEPQQCKSKSNVRIIQPGSSVATSLAQGESVTKKVAILNVFKNKFKMNNVTLKTVRPFVFEDLILNDFKDEISSYKSRQDAVEEFIDNYIENTLIPLATEQLTGHPKQPQTPLIRLRIFYSDDRDVFDTLQLTQKYNEVAANPNDMIVFRKCSSKLKKKDLKVKERDLGEVGEIFRFDDKEKDWKRTVQGGMTEYFNKDDKVNKLTVLSLTGLNESLARFVNANDNNAFKDLVKYQMEKSVNCLKKQNFKSKEEIVAAIKEYRDSRLHLQKEEAAEEDSFFNTRNNVPIYGEDDLKMEDDSKMVGDENLEEVVTTRGRGRGRGQSRGKGITSKTKETASTPAKRGRGRGRASKNTSTLDITTTKGNQSVMSWTKKATKITSVVLDSDSE